MKKQGSPQTDPKPNPPPPLLPATLPSCHHNFVFLREKNVASGLLPVMVDVFYCCHCLVYRERDK